MASMTNSNSTPSESKTTDLRALLESNENVNHIPKAFRQMHNYIKKLEEENEKLKEENEELISEKEELFDRWEAVNEEKEELEEENEKLKEEVDAGEKCLEIRQSSWVANKRLLEENQKLKDENKKLSQDYSKYFMECCSSDIEIKKLKEENEKLKEEAGYLGSGEQGLAKAGEWMSKSSKNILCIKNFSDNEDEYRIDGGKEELDELQFEEYKEEDLKDIEFYAEK